MQQWPSLGELIMHLVRRVGDDLEAAIAYKDKRMDLLTKKIQVLERQSPESPPPEIVRLQQKGFSIADVVWACDLRVGNELSECIGRWTWECGEKRSMV